MQYKLNPAITEQELRGYGFTDFSNGYWYYCKILYQPSISFNLDVLKSDYSKIQIDVLDDDFCQPYDYEYILSEINKNAKVANRVKKEYDKMIAKLLKDKILLEA